MSDPNGEAAGLAFLEENKGKSDVITLPSGLQYKVIVEGGGVEHPTVATPCECHYAGRLLDGTEFDSSYKRGTPTTFAPNQVIKGWTVQMMVTEPALPPPSFFCIGFHNTCHFIHRTLLAVGTCV